jgi:hypothetical protein
LAESALIPEHSGNNVPTCEDWETFRQLFVSFPPSRRRDTIDGVTKGVYAALAASVLLNVFFLVRGRFSPTTQVVSPRAHVVPADLTETSSNKTFVAAAQIKTASDLQRAQSFGWSSVESADYKTYIANLRAVGCPPETIRDIVSQDLRKHYKRKQWEILRKAATTNYWSPEFVIGTRLETDQLNGLQALGNEFSSAFKELLSTEPDEPLTKRDDDVEMELLALYGDLDWDTVQKIVPLQKSVNSKLSSLGSDPKEEKFLEVKTEVIKAAEEMLSLLSEEQREAFQMRNSPLAARLRKSFGTRLASEDQFRQAYFRALDVLGTDSVENVSSTRDDELSGLIFGAKP